MPRPLVDSILMHVNPHDKKSQITAIPIIYEALQTISNSKRLLQPQYEVLSPMPSPTYRVSDIGHSLLYVVTILIQPPLRGLPFGRPAY
jgi:hypothetical protein